MNVWVARFSALSLLLASGFAAGQNTYSAYINSDGDTATGCVITLPGGTFAGAEWRVQATATTGSSPQVTSVTLAQCGGGVFGAGTPIGGNYPVGLNDGTSGSDVVEFSAPKGSILGNGSYAAPLGFVAENASGSDVLFAADGGGGGGIVLGMVAPTPALGAVALILLALLLLLIARRTGRGRLYRRVLGLSLFAICGIAIAATFFDDGQVGDWNGISPIATDPAGDPSNASPDIDLRAAFVAVDGGQIHFRLDVTDMQTQSPAITSANATTFYVGTPGTFTVTATGVPTPALTSTCVPALPAGVTFVDNGNGTATLAGTPPLGSTNTYACTLTASNAIPPDATQNFTFTIANAPSTTALVVDTNPSVFGQSVTFTATVTATPPGSGTPTGTVTFLDGATSIGTGTLDGSGVATLATGALSVATHSITAQYAGDANFGPSTSTAVSQVVNQAATTTALTSGANPSVFGQNVTFTATVTPTAPGAGTPTGTVTFKDGATTLGTGTLAGGVATFSTSTLSVTTHPVTAVYAGDTSFQTSTSSTVSQVVNQASQTITYTSTAPAAASVGGASYSVTATGGASGNPVVFTIDASASAVCSIAGTTVSFTAVGTCVIDANQAGNTNYLAAPQVQQSFAVGQGSQTITFTSTAPANAVVGGATYNVTATGGASGNPVIFSIDATAAGICSIAGSTVSFAAAGTCVIDANQAGNANYTAAPQAQQSFAVGKNNQTITFTSTAPAGAVVAGPTYLVTATATSGLTVAFTIDASAGTVCSIAGSTVSFIGAGTCVIDANQAGDANYNAAPQVQQSFAVGKGNQTITYTSTAPAAAQVGGPTYNVTATATSALPVTFTIDATASSVCSIAGSAVSFIGAGTCVIDANQAGDANWNPAPQAQQSFAVAKGNQTISFTSTAPAGAQFNGPTYTVTATATSGLAVTFTIDASATSVCSIAGSTVSFIGVGTCVIDANQAGDANYNAAPQAQQSFAVGKADQTISFTSTAPGGAVVNGPTYTVSATATSGLAVAFTIDASASAVCSIAGSTVSFNASGTCIIDANQAGNANYNAAPQLQQSFLVNKADQMITFTSTAPVSAKNGGATYTVTATATSGLAVTFSSGAATICSVAGSTVSFIGAGTCIINADQAGNAAYNPAPQVQQSFLVAKGDQTITFTSVLAAFSATGTTYTATATATSGLAVTFSIDGTSTSGCTIAGSTVTFTAPIGSCVIDANQPGDANWNPATQVQQSTTVEVPVSATDDSHAVTGNVAISVPLSGVLGNDTGNPIAISSYGATTGAEQTSIGTATATAQGGSVTLNADGSYTFTPKANFNGTDTFKYVIGNDVSTSTGTVTLTVSDRIMVVTTGGGGSCVPASPCTLAVADAAASVSPNIDLVYVESGTYASAAFSMTNKQKLVGQAVDLAQAISDAGITLALDSVGPTNIAATVRPVFNNSANVISLAGNNLVEYFNINPSGGAAIVSNAVTTGATVHDITVAGTGAGAGVNITGNSTGSTFNFNNLVVGTAAGNAFSAVGSGPGAATGGTLNITTGSIPNTLTTTTGTALNVINTSIAASGLTFQSINVNGASKGIILNTTGTAAGNGGLTVTGVSTTAGSGGTIQNISVRGAEFTTTKALSLKNMNFTNANTTDAGGVGVCDDLTTTGCNAAIYLSGVSGAAFDRINITGTTVEEGINGNNVSNFSLSNSTLTNCGTNGGGADLPGEESCIKMRELTGTSSITNSDLSFPSADVVEIVNTAGPLLTLNVNSSIFRDSQSSASGNTGLQARSQGTASMALNVTNSSFVQIRTVGLQATAINSASNDVDVSNSTFDTGTGTMIGLDLDADNTGTLVFNVQNNPRIWSSNGPAINVFGDTNATINGRINNNPDVRVLTHVGSNVGSGIRANINKDANARLEVKNNVVNVGSDDAGIDLSAIGKTTANPGGTTNTLDATVTGNTVTIGSTSTYGVVILDATNAGDTNALCANVSTNTITRDPSSITSFRARVPSANGFFRMQNFVTDAEATWNGNSNMPTSAAGSEVSFGGSGTFATCTVALPTNPMLTRWSGNMAEPFLSEIRMASFNFAPKGWALCDGQLLPINQNQALFSLLGTTYGGDGRVNFALPDLRGRTPIHVSRGITWASVAESRPIRCP